ncbi:MULTISPECIES: hypothetical protein [unclassified Geodermatophilus]|uniref:hypothetical protein n=1 Tax=unclassified Geodermatophilus TaxID=2637632 RepID=UPI003EE8AAE3
MSAPIPCLRHSERKWLAYCDDCKAWHLARQIAARDAAARNTAARDLAPRVTVAPRLTVVPAVARGSVPALTAVA